MGLTVARSVTVSTSEILGVLIGVELNKGDAHLSGIVLPRFVVFGNDEHLRALCNGTQHLIAVLSPRTGRQAAVQVRRPSYD